MLMPLPGLSIGLVMFHSFIHKCLQHYNHYEYTMNTKKITVLHSNDMHGDFYSESSAEKAELIGGLSLLSGYINIPIVLFFCQKCECTVAL